MQIKINYYSELVVGLWLPVKLFIPQAITQAFTSDLFRRSVENH